MVWGLNKEGLNMGKKYKLGYTAGVFDMFHIGHLNILRKAKEQCEKLVVGVTTDDLCWERKKKYPIICEKDRVERVKAIRYVDEVILQTNMDKSSIVEKLKCDAVFVGSDWRGTQAWEKYEKEFEKYGCIVVYLDHTDGISSTVLRNKLNLNT